MIWSNVIIKTDTLKSNLRLTWSAITPINGPNRISGSIQRMGIVETRKGDPVISKE